MAVEVHELPELPEDAPSGQSTRAGMWMLNNSGDTAALIDLLGEVITEVIASVEAEQLLGASDQELAGLLQGLEQCRNRLSVVDHHLVHAVESSRLHERLEYRTVAKMLHTCLRIPYGDASARVRAAQDLRAGYAMSGERLVPKYPHLAAAAATGKVEAGQTDTAVRCLRQIEKLPWTGPEDVAEADEVLAGPAMVFDPTEYRRITHRVLEHVHPDGTLADDQMKQLGVWRCSDAGTDPGDSTGG